MSTNQVFLSGAALLQAIRALKPIHTVKLIAIDEARGRLTADQAYLVAKGGDYEGQIKDGRVRFIRELPANRPEWQVCWRTTEAATFAFDGR